MIKVITAEQYLEFLSSYNRREMLGVKKLNDIELNIRGNFSVPSDILILPEEVKTVFLDDFYAEGSSLEYFNSKVHGNAQFANSKFLHVLGEDAYFEGDVNLSNTHIKEFNNIVKGNANLSSKSLQEVGPKAVFGGNVDLSNSNIKIFNSRVSGDANLSFNHNLKEIGPDATFGGSLNIYYSGIQVFNSEVNGWK